MNKKSLTYLLIISFVLSCGTIFSSPAVPSTETNKAESQILSDTPNSLLNFLVCRSGESTDYSREIDWNNCLCNEKFRGYSIKNYPLHESVLHTNKNYRRTGTWFTSQLKN
ncbi:MAG: hypothetical protein CVV24_02435 [Ignavibacteriae bacterium HGW-Ignavibacteriae-3]|nr:MAG: hypothetical protein CVV24_02435 [Ignavibacteriae bacterium HGW-Ignavibacteriae-3]